MSTMDVKISENSSKKEESAVPVVKKKISLFRFIQEMKDELKKVSWTSKQELIFSTKTVVIAAFVFGFGVYLVDLSIRNLLEMVKTALHVIFG